ncbi:MAG: hypothetical protein ACK4OO_06610, partial [bacterium]
MAVLFWAIMTSGIASAYNISIEFLVREPVMFPIGRLIPGDLSYVDTLDFGDFEPFFRFRVTGDPPPDSARLFVRFSQGGVPIFTASSRLIDIDEIRDQWLTTRELEEKGIQLETGSKREIANSLLQYVDGGYLRTGFYLLTIILSEEESYEAALGNNVGVGNLGFFAHSTTQLSLLQPLNGATLSSQPILIWSFPRSGSVEFLLEVVKGNRGDDPYAVMESANQVNTFLRETVLSQGGEFTIFTYTGSGGQRPLEAGTYFWRVTARIPTMFEGEYETVVSSIYSFDYQPPQREQWGGGGGEGEGGGRGFG